MILKTHKQKSSQCKILRIGLEEWGIHDFGGSVLRREKYEKFLLENDTVDWKKLTKLITETYSDLSVVLVIDGFPSWVKIIPGKIEGVHEPERRHEIVLSVMKGMKQPEPIVWAVSKWDEERLLFCAFKKESVEGLVDALERAGVAVEAVWPGCLVDYEQVGAQLLDEMGLLISHHKVTVFYPKNRGIPFKTFNWDSLDALEKIFNAFSDSDKNKPWHVQISDEDVVPRKFLKQLNVTKILSHTPYKDYPWDMLPNRKFPWVQHFFKKILSGMRYHQWLLGLIFGSYALGAGMASYRESDVLRAEIHALKSQLDTSFKNWRIFSENPKVLRDSLHKENFLRLWDKLNVAVQELQGVRVHAMGFSRQEDGLMGLDRWEAEWLKGPPLLEENLEKVRKRWEVYPLWPELMDLEMQDRSWLIATKLIDPKEAGGEL